MADAPVRPDIGAGLHETGGEDVAATGESRADFAASEKPVPRAGATTIYNRRSDVEV